MEHDTTTSRVSLLVEGYPRYGFSALSELIKMGWDAICITRLHPEYVVEKYELGKARCLWLSSRKGKNVLSPRSLNEMVRRVRSTVSRKRECIVFLDGLEYLLLWNDLSKVIAALKEIDAVLSGHSEMLVCIDPLTLEQRDLQRLWAEFPRYSANDVAEALSSRLPQQSAGALPSSLSQTIEDLLGSRVSPATP